MQRSLPRIKTGALTAENAESAEGSAVRPAPRSPGTALHGGGLGVRQRWGTLALAGVSLVALAVRWAMFGRVTGDMINFLVPWYNYIVAHGGYRALADGFSNYSPPYTYFLVAVTYLRPYLPTVVAIKSIAVAFDFLAAAVMYRLVRLKYPSGHLPIAGYAAVLLAPTVAINSAYWGQADITYTTFLLLAVLAALLNRALLTVLSFGLALAFKAQAAFLAPFLLILLFRRRLSWWHLPLAPAVYLLLALPAAYLGRPLPDLLTVYLQQSTTFRSLSMNAPNLYEFIPDAYYLPATLAGLAAAALAGLGVALLARRSRVELSRETLLKAATLSVALMPLLLPKMHDRYFFPADLLSIGLAFYSPALILVPIAFQCTSAIAYLPYLVGREVIPVRYAGVANALIVGLLLVVYLRALFPARAPEDARPDST